MSGRIPGVWRRLLQGGGAPRRLASRDISNSCQGVFLSTQWRLRYVEYAATFAQLVGVRSAIAHIRAIPGWCGLTV
jgi:hypothetical protein